jgi:hypothetical protein
MFIRNTMWLGFPVPGITATPFWRDQRASTKNTETPCWQNYIRQNIIAKQSNCNFYFCSDLFENFRSSSTVLSHWASECGISRYGNVVLLTKFDNVTLPRWYPRIERDLEITNENFGTAQKLWNTWFTAIGCFFTTGKARRVCICSILKLLIPISLTFPAWEAYENKMTKIQANLTGDCQCRPRLLPALRCCRALGVIAKRILLAQHNTLSQ